MTGYDEYKTPKELKREEFFANVKFGFTLITGTAIAINVLQTLGDACWYPKTYEGGKVEVTLEDGFSVTHTSKGEDEHYILFDYGVQNPYKVSERIQQMIDREQIPEKIDYAIFFSDATREVIVQNTTLKSDCMINRYDADYSTQLLHTNAHQHRLPSAKDNFFIDGVNIQYNADGIMADNGVSCIVCSSDNQLMALASDLVSRNPKDVRGDSTRLKRQDMHIIIPEGSMPMDNVEYLQSLGATVETISESRTAVLDQNGYHVDLTGFDLTLEENELDTFAQLEDK